MTSATLYREGDDLDALLAELDEQHPGRVRVVEVSYPRTGGLGGFFAKQRVGVEYVLTQGLPSAVPAMTPRDVTPAPGRKRPSPKPRPQDAPPSTAAVTGDPFDELIAQAESAEQAFEQTRSAVAVQGTGQAGTSNAEFAKLLLDLAAKKSANRKAAEAAAEAQQRPAEAPPAPALPPVTQQSAVIAPPATQQLEGQFEGQPEAQFEDGVVEVPTFREFSKIDAQLSAPEKIADLTALEFGPALSPPLFRTVTRTGEEVAPARPVQPESFRSEPVQQRAEAPATRSAAPAPTDPAAPAVPVAGGGGLAGLELRRKLAELGVPLRSIPTDPQHPYAVVEDLVAKLPAVEPLPIVNGTIVVLAGPAAQIARAADHLISKLRLRPENIWSTEAAVPGRLVADVWQAQEAAAAVRQGSEGPALFIVVTDNAEADHGEIIRALQPDALWAHVDATRKPADTRQALARLGAPTALVVTGAQHTCSPATVWELGVPAALLDHRPATTSAWAVLLLDKLSELGA